MLNITYRNRKQTSGYETKTKIIDVIEQLTGHVSRMRDNRNLRSADQCLLVVPRYNMEGYGRRAFSVSGPALWNSLPENIRQSDTLAKFKALLKTHLFKLAYYQ